ncbi:MAG: hypothetical protein LBQ58_04055 [Synergistaceae bacterium]|jgi:prolyl-tRNA synthetase|nr:hypothetical protein [Synergistaceae bacterium]
MGNHILLVPKTENSPAKIKDPGVINMVKAGSAVYNAKSGEVLLLPDGETKMRTLASELKSALFETCGIQPVDCGSDSAILSVAERFARDYGDDATAFCEERGRTLRILSWNKDVDVARSRALLMMDAAINILRSHDVNPRGVTFSFVQEAVASGALSFSLASCSDAGAIGARQGVFCNACGAISLPDSPNDFKPISDPSDEVEEALEDVETPGANTIAELCDQLGIDELHTIKAMLYAASDSSGELRAVAAFVRGDRNISMNKLSSWVKTNLEFDGLHTAMANEVQSLIGEVAGYCGPIGMPQSVHIVADVSVKDSKNMVVGANRPGYHRKGCCHPRDFNPAIADIACVTPGAPCSCGGTFESSHLRESGVLQLGLSDEIGGGGIGALSWRDRVGTHDYPIICSCNISLESILLATG